MLFAGSDSVERGPLYVLMLPCPCVSTVLLDRQQAFLSFAFRVSEAPLGRLRVVIG